MGIQDYPTWQHWIAGPQLLGHNSCTTTGQSRGAQKGAASQAAASRPVVRLEMGKIGGPRGADILVPKHDSRIIQPCMWFMEEPSQGSVV